MVSITVVIVEMYSKFPKCFPSIPKDRGYDLGYSSNYRSSIPSSVPSIFLNTGVTTSVIIPTTVVVFQVMSQAYQEYT